MQVGEMVLEEDEIECAYCWHLVPDEQGQPVPAVDDEDEWERLAALHHADCEWVLTRAHQAVIECAYCRWFLPHEQIRPDPAVDDEDEWKRLAALHHADCEWALTRGHRVEFSETVLRRSEDGTAVLWLRDFSDGRRKIGPLGGEWQDVADYEEMGAILAEWDAAVNA